MSLDDAIEAMRVTARDMHSAYKVRCIPFRYLSRRDTLTRISHAVRVPAAQETSLSGLATSVKIPVSSPAC